MLERKAILGAASWALLLLSTRAAAAEDPQLAALRTTLASLRAHAAPPAVESIGVTEELTVAKHRLRDWIESQLAQTEGDRDIDTLSRRINDALAPFKAQSEDDGPNYLGTLAGVRLSEESGLVVVVTGVGILCQYDESVYVYERVQGRWRRVLESERNRYARGEYKPEHIQAVHVWRAGFGGKPEAPAFVMELGNEVGCASSWHPVYFRVSRVDPGGQKLLIDQTEGAWQRSLAGLIVGSLGSASSKRSEPVDVLIEFTQRSIDGGVHNRQAVRHYQIGGEQVRRIAPVALSPRDFVDEWLTRDWKESSAWSAGQPLQAWHAKLHKDVVSGYFSDGTRHCKTPDLWQIAFVPEDLEEDLVKGPAVHFLLRWRPPYRFTMVDIASQPWPQCTEPDREPDQWRTLFATQEWR